MNKYTAAGLLAAAHEGKRIIVISHRQAEARDALEAFERLAPDGMLIIRANGDERIVCASGGEIRLCTRRTSFRSRTADIIFIEDREDVDHELTREVQHLIATNPHGEIIFA